MIINIAILLRKPHRTPLGVMRVREIASTLGLKLTTSGRVSISAKVPPDVFAQLFGVSPTEQASMTGNDYDFGSPRGYMSAEDIPVPTELSSYVEAISIVPPARRLF